MPDRPNPTERELAILKVLWERQEATVREVYEDLRRDLPIVQNTVQAFLRTMEQKGLADHRTVGRSFVYRAAIRREDTERRMLSGVLDQLFDGSLDQLVASALAVRRPTQVELRRLQELLRSAPEEPS